MWLDIAHDHIRARLRARRAASSMAYVLPTPADAPKKTRSRPRLERASSACTCEQLVGVGTRFGSHQVDHGFTQRIQGKVQRSTLTRGSPRIPKAGHVCRAMSALTSPAPRALRPGH